MAARSAERRNVLIYELNEVPWTIYDRFVSERPASNVARLVRDGMCETTVNPDEELSPWRTWPTFHKGVLTAEHKSLHLGQDPATFVGQNIWDIAEESGLSIGVFGPLQSWPAHHPQHGGFYVSDTFSRDSVVYPRTLERFQAFNLTMTRELGFSADASLNPRQMAIAGLDIAVRGLTPWSIAMIIRHLIRERREPRYKAARSIFQVLPAFDLFWRLHRRRPPNLSIFFSNHVAGMMHRFWGDASPEYAEQYDYERDEIYGRFITEALAIFDHQLGRILKFIDTDPGTTLMVVSSMGQEPWPYQHIGDTYVMRQVTELARTLELGSVEEGLAMYPVTSLAFPSTHAAEQAVQALGHVMADGEPLFKEARADGRTVSFEIRFGDQGELVREISHGTVSSPEPVTTSPIEALGIRVEPRLGGGNTAYHSSEGPMITYGSAVAADPSRMRFDVREAAPRILKLLGVSDEEPA